MTLLKVKAALFARVQLKPSSVFSKGTGDMLRFLLSVAVPYGSA